jgi:hypothetical protein
MDYHLQQDDDLKTGGHHLPTSTRTVWAILNEHGRIVRALKREHEPIERPEPLRSWQIDFKDVTGVLAESGGKQQHVVAVGTSVALEAVARDVCEPHIYQKTLRNNCDAQGYLRFLFMTWCPRCAR